MEAKNRGTVKDKRTAPVVRVSWYPQFVALLYGGRDWLL